MLHVVFIGLVQKALAIDPLNAPAHYNLSTVYTLQGKLSDAQQEINRFNEAEAAKNKGGIPK